QHHVEYRGGGAEVDSPEHVAVGGLPGGLVRSQEVQQGGLESKAEQREEQSAEERTVKAKGAALGNCVVVPAAQRAAHQAGAAHAEEVVYGVEGQHDGGGERDGRVLDGVVEHADKIGV